MRLVSCPKCGVVVNLDDMEELNDINNEEEFDKKTEQLNTCFSSEDSYIYSGFHCPCCKKWVNIDN